MNFNAALNKVGYFLKHLKNNCSEVQWKDKPMRQLTMQQCTERHKSQGSDQITSFIILFSNESECDPKALFLVSPTQAQCAGPCLRGSGKFTIKKLNNLFHHLGLQLLTQNTIHCRKFCFKKGVV